MCGRYCRHYSIDEIVRHFDVQFVIGNTETLRTERYDIAPTQRAPVVVAAAPGLGIEAGAGVKTGDRLLDTMRWGLVPFWAKDLKIGAKMINARSETLATSPAFRTALSHRRCLLPADGFYEWMPGAVKQPICFRRKDRGLFAFAGLWDTWRAPDGVEMRSCTIITTEPNALVSLVHDRMPAMLDGADAAAWLDVTGASAAQALSLLRPYDVMLMESHPVDKPIGSPKEEAAQLILPL